MNRGATALSFELDADLFWLSLDPSASDRPKTLSLGRYAITRGVDRVLSILADKGVRATWFVPGLITQREPECIAKVISDGHEVGSRGWGPGALGGLSYDDQYSEIQRGIDAIKLATGTAPRGFRAPAGEVDENTFRALEMLGVSWSSCLHGADAPTRVEIDGKSSVLDIGTRWELTDYVHFQFNYGPVYPAGADRIASYSSVLREWTQDALATTALGDPCVFTLSPDVIGKPGRSMILSRLIDEVHRSGAEFMTLGEIASRALKGT